MQRRWAGRSLRFDAAAKRRVRAGVAAAGGGGDNPRVREESCRQRGAGCVSGDSRPPPIGALPRRFAATSNRSERPAIAVASTAIGVPGRNYIDLENAPRGRIIAKADARLTNRASRHPGSGGTRTRAPRSRAPGFAHPYYRNAHTKLAVADRSSGGHLAARSAGPVSPGCADRSRASSRSHLDYIRKKTAESTWEYA